MYSLIADKLPWLLSGLSIYIQWQLGNKKSSAWIVSLVCQCLWLVWIFTVQKWGFLPLNISLWILSIRNYWKWRNADAVT